MSKITHNSNKHSKLRKLNEIGWHKRQPRNNPNYKTIICKNWENGFCQYGSNCAFAHGENELPSKKIEYFISPIIKQLIDENYSLFELPVESIINDNDTYIELYQNFNPKIYWSHPLRKK